ncbi:MAG: heparinase II/III-family protein [Planctomycetota bacterium]|nr:heparinase II/III-family protein [Planctomycetota bacterium]
MKRRDRLGIIIFTVLVFLGSGLVAAGEAGPGLEVFDTPADGYDFPPNATPVQPEGATASNATPVVTPAFPVGSFEGGVVIYPEASSPILAEPEANVTGEPYFLGSDGSEVSADQGNVDPEVVLALLNADNVRYPGLAGAVTAKNLPLAADIILRVLRERRIVEASLTRGPGGSRGVVAPHETMFLGETLNAAEYNPDTTLTGVVRRVDFILNTFAQPIIDDFGYGALMERILLRLAADLTLIQAAMANPPEDATYHEISRVYFRTATTCDFFIFYREDLSARFREVISSAGTMFYPDGASLGGDVGGISGSVFQNLLMIDAFTYGDFWYRRQFSSGWRVLERPARYLLDLALPDLSLPGFGPRGERELDQVDIAKLKLIFPPPPGSERPRLGLDASYSFPERSGIPSYGGVFVSRSDVGANSRYLAVRFGPRGFLPGIPAHNDFGSLVVSSGNIRFLSDARGFGGAAAEAASHSVLSLAGAFSDPAGYNPPGTPVDSVWRTNAALDYASDSVNLTNGKNWRRSVLFVKKLPGEGAGDYWLVLDGVDARGDNSPQPVNVRFQLAPGIQAYHDGSGMLMTTDYGYGSALRLFALDANSQLTVSEGELGITPSYIYDNTGGAIAAPAINLERTVNGNSITATLLYPGENSSFRPIRIERDSDVIHGHTGAIVIDHGNERVDVLAWTPGGGELVTPTLSLQLSADVALFRLRKGKLVRLAFVGLTNFQAKEPEGGEWALRVRGGPATLFLEPEQGGGWQVLSDAANPAITLDDIRLGPAINLRRSRVRMAPGEVVIFPR